MSKNVTIDWQLEDAASGPRVIGLIALSSDLTLERDVSRMVPAGQVAVYVNRIHNQNPMTLENLAAMQNDMAEAAAGILPESRLDAIAYGCTSGTVAIGPQKVIDIISGARPGVAVTTPITAALDGFRMLGIQRIAVLTPYPHEVNAPITAWLEENGISVLSLDTFGMDSDVDVARIPPEAIIAAASAADHADADAVFLSCTALRSVECIADLEQRLGKPVLTSNQAMLWRALRLAGYDGKIPGYGELMLR